MNQNLALCNGRIFTEYQVLDNHAVLISRDRILAIVPSDEIPSDFEVIDLQGGNICPGLIDLQIYGTDNDLFSAELTVESLSKIDQNLLKQGCTSYMPTLATNKLAVFKTAIDVFRQVQSKVALGLHLEGPFLNPAKRGAHPEELIVKATKPILEDLLQGQDVVKIMTIAAELMDQECIDYLQEQGVRLTLGHSTATYQQATSAFNKGVGMVTHLWNAMSPFHHREVGIPGAAFSHASVAASIIVDGIHVDYEAVRLSKELMGERLFLITDAVAACNKGVYQHVLNGDHYVMPDGTLSGSALSLLQAVKNCVQHVGIDLSEALRMATLYPARQIARDDIGNLRTHSLANILVFDSEYRVQQVVFEGKRII